MYSSNFLPKDVFSHLDSCIQNVVDNRPCYVRDPVSDMTRKRRLPMDETIRLVLCMSNKDNREELASYFKDCIPPSDSALLQQRKKILPEAFEAIFHRLSLPLKGRLKTWKNYRLIGIDGSDCRYLPDYSDPDSLVPIGKGQMQGCLHLHAAYDLLNDLFEDAICESGSANNEVQAVEDMIARKYIPPNSLLICDRNYGCYHLMACCMEHGQHFLIRLKDKDSAHSLLKGIEIGEGPQDLIVCWHLYRSQTLASKADPLYKVLPTNNRFPYLESWSREYYDMKYRVVRFVINKEEVLEGAEPVYECLATNLTRDEASLEELSELYAIRWSHEVGYRYLKQNLKMTWFHTRQRELVLQEVYASIIMHNVTALVVQCAREVRTEKYRWKPDFSTAVVNVRLCFKHELDVEILLLRIEKCLVPIRPGRKAVRNLKDRGPKQSHYR